MRRSWPTPQTLEDPGGHPGLREAPETSEDYEELPCSRPSMTWISIRHCLLEFLLLTCVCVRQACMAYLYTVFIASLLYLDWLLDALVTMRENGYGKFYDMIVLACLRSTLWGARDRAFSGGKLLAENVYWAHSGEHLWRVREEKRRRGNTSYGCPRRGNTCYGCLWRTTAGDRVRSACPSSYGHMR